jgi:leucyl-tRNA synthetase
MQFALEGGRLPKKLATLEVFTTRHDTIFGASFMAISPEHPLAANLAQKKEELAAFIEECRKIGTTEEALAKAEKKGFDTGIVAVHPFKPDVKLPVYVANFIVMGYGTGAIFGCPAHDQRDLDFARKYHRPVLPVVIPQGGDPKTFTIGDEATRAMAMTNSQFLDGLTVEQAKKRSPRSSRRGEEAQVAIACAIGASPSALLGLPDPGDPLPACGVVPVPSRTCRDAT